MERTGLKKDSGNEKMNSSCRV